MKFNVDAYLGSNITVVFDSLDISSISRDKIRAAMGQAAFMDTPDLLVIMAPPGIVIQIAERRIVTSDQTQSPPDKIDLWSPATIACTAVSGSKIVAYGFNYDVGVTLEGVTEAGAHLTHLFLPTAEALQDSLEVQGLSAIPRLNYFRNSAQYDLRLEPLDGPKVKVHLNAHFAEKPLPDSEMLGQSFVSEFDEIGRVLGSL